MSDYLEMLKDPRWQRRRLEVLERAGFSCDTCEANDRTLHVHHRYYEYGKKPWEYGDEVLECLCEDCHQDATRLDRALKKHLRLLEDQHRYQTLGYMLGLLLRDRVVEEADLGVRSYETIVGLFDAFDVDLSPSELQRLVKYEYATRWGAEQFRWIGTKLADEAMYRLASGGES